MDGRAALVGLKTRKISFVVRDDIVLRSISCDDVTQGYVDGLNDADVRRHLGASNATVQTIETVSSYVDTNAKSLDAILFGVFVGAQLCGTVRVHDMNFNRGSAIVGIALFDKSLWGKGIGRAALMEACHIGQARLGLCVLSAIIKSENEASKTIFGKAGFVQDQHQVELWVCRLNEDSGNVIDQTKE